MKADTKIKTAVQLGIQKKYQEYGTDDNLQIERIKLRWVGLLFFSILTFILLSNSHYIRLQSEAAAMEKPDSIKLEPPPRNNVALLEKSPGVNETSAATELTNNVQNNNHLLPEQTLALHTLLPNKITSNTSADTSDLKQHSWVVRSGDTLSEILSRFGVYASLGLILELGRQAKPLLYLRTGKQMHLDIESGILQKITYEVSQTEHFIVKRSADGRISTEHYHLPIEKREAFTASFIDGSFYHAGLKAGLSDKLIVEAAYILGWDIDFVLDIRSGDFFNVIYEEEFLDGIKIGTGDILGIELINRGNSYRAIRYTDAKDKVGYFSPEGKNVKKPFLRTPLEFTRISSKFNPKRLHPILNTVRPHRGVDYAAVSGTPVHATAKGKVIFRGWKAGYGNVLILRHHGAYTTLYAHLSKFARSIKVGSSVQQRQVIGYVGMTGYATGPHLHYEFRINGTHKNPLTVALPDSRPLPQSQLTAFKQSIQPTLQKLNSLNRSYIAAK